MKIDDLYHLAFLTAVSRCDRRGFLIGAVGVRCDGAIVKSANGLSERRNRHAHAEARLARKLDIGSVVYVVRVRRRDYTFGNARPCRDCQRALAARGVRRVFYTINETEHDVLDL